MAHLGWKYPAATILRGQDGADTRPRIYAKNFRDLGALHVGQTTDSNTHYSEVREELLPSGLLKFSTLQAMSPAEPLQEGPFVPSVPYDGDIADTAALQRWIVTLATAP
jgi:hypothetical protein